MHIFQSESNFFTNCLIFSRNVFIIKYADILSRHADQMKHNYLIFFPNRHVTSVSRHLLENVIGKILVKRIWSNIQQIHTTRYKLIVNTWQILAETLFFVNNCMRTGYMIISHVSRRKRFNQNLSKGWAKQLLGFLLRTNWTVTRAINKHELIKQITDEKKMWTS